MKPERLTAEQVSEGARRLARLREATATGANFVLTLDSWATWAIVHGDALLTYSGPKCEWCGGDGRGLYQHLCEDCGGTGVDPICSGPDGVDNETKGE